MTNSDKTKSVHGGWVNKDIKLTGKTAIITGANTGIGLITAIDFVRRGAKVFMACRNPQKAEEARKKVLEESGCKETDVVIKKLDLSSFASIREFCKNFNEGEERLDILLNNAGVMGCPQGKTEDGFETHFGTNHLGHFLLTNLLLDKIQSCSPSRIVTVSSGAHTRKQMNWGDMNNDKSYSAFNVYGQSKLMNVLFNHELAKRLQGTGVTTYSLHPGVIKTDLWRHMYDGNQSIWRSVLKVVTAPIRGLFFISPDKGAQTSIYCSIAPELEKETGKYYDGCAQKEPSAAAKSDADAKKLWEISEKLTGLVTEDQN